MSYLLFPSDTSTGEDDNVTGFDSGSSSADKGRGNEEPRFFPRISRTNSNRVFVTSGVGEDKGGSQHDDRSHSKSHESGKQGSANEDEDFGSTMDLAKSSFLYLHVIKRSLNAFFFVSHQKCFIRKIVQKITIKILPFANSRVRVNVF